MFHKTYFYKKENMVQSRVHLMFSSWLYPTWNPFENVKKSHAYAHLARKELNSQWVCLHSLTQGMKEMQKRECVPKLRIEYANTNTHCKVQTSDFSFKYNSATSYIELNWHLLNHSSYQISSKSDVTAKW